MLCDAANRMFIRHFVHPYTFYSDFCNYLYYDPWLVAMASAKDYVLVTQEVASGLFVAGQPHKNIKIPEVSLHFDVRTINLFDMMKELHIVV